MAAALIKLLLKTCALLPLRLSHGLGAAIGYLLYLLPNQARHVCRVNTDLCFPEQTARQRRRLLRDTLIETGKTFTEMGAIWYWPAERLLALIRQVHNRQLLTDALRQGRGILLMTPHLGCWEILNFYLSRQGRFTCMYKPPRMAGLDTVILNARKRTGSRLAPTTTSGVKMLYSALKQGEMVGVLPDQNPGKDQGVYAPFFGIPANTMPLVLRLARQTRPLVLLIYSRRLRKGKGYDIYLQQLDDDIYHSDQVVAASCLNRAMEQAIRQAPEQYQWSYKKFKYQPDGRKFYG